jgi:hypothetical protein
MLVLSRSSERRSERDNALRCEDDVEVDDDSRGSRGALSRSLMLQMAQRGGGEQSSCTLACQAVTCSKLEQDPE